MDRGRDFKGLKLFGVQIINEGDDGDEEFMRKSQSMGNLTSWHSDHVSELGFVDHGYLSDGGLLQSGRRRRRHDRKRGQRIPKQSRSPIASTSHFVTEESDSYDLSNIVTKDNKLPLFPFSVIATSTNNFSNETKIGEGGFGPDHKGTLPDGQQIAVKRLSKHFGQGVDEFKNEIKLIANLQHKNLVRLLGCSIKDSEKLLVYEYMANGSLDKYLFDPIKAVHLDWKRRIGIIDGIAQGLLYLHKYSRLRIIHRDRMCSNILLDADMNPKISDFGIARIFGGNQNHANTIRVVRTYGYMSPEYAIKGLFSTAYCFWRL